MKNYLLTLLLCISCLSGYSQIYRITFNSSGDAYRINWIKATNLNTHESITVPGNNPVFLEVIWPHFSGAASIPVATEDGVATTEGLIYPNPFQGKTTLFIDVPTEQKVCVTIRTLAGQEVAQTTEVVGAGGNEFSISVPASGIYFVTATTDRGTTAFKTIATEPAGTESTVTYRGASGSMQLNSPGSGFKVGRITKTLRMYNGDVILYECNSGRMTTLLAESPDATKEYQVKFTNCTDRSGKDYPVIQVGNYFWMSENMSWLPGVNKVSEGSADKPRFYVYGYQGSDLRKAKERSTYQEYGVLYNWEAARDACPKGWRLPTDQEWLAMEEELGMSPDEAVQAGWRHTGDVGCKLKECGTDHWRMANPFPTKISGFNAVAGGYAPIAIPGPDKTKSGTLSSGSGNFGFVRLGMCSFYWTSSEIDEMTAWSRRLGCSENGVARGTSMKSFGYSVRCIRDAAPQKGPVDNEDW
jgi:uncharacterized protein (TIGR02145 family)